ncbi:carboxylesterase family protein [Asticcacaulis sp. 201]|nr:carboxylesterase family protein [Asticcacaulis sp. 201]MDV6331222.1 carboxylesterase family protein [Asticcacaulis sp. 201]
MLRSRNLICALAGLTWLAAQPSLAETSTAPVKVSGGQIAGIVSDGLEVYLGVPFAAPPVGRLRWRPPQPVIPWTGIKPTQSFSPACAPNADWLPNAKSEDCLYLNVWAPEGATHFPVIVWIHGGGYYGGTAGQSLFDGARLAQHGVIVVSMNYRLGIFGFFSHPELSAESPTKTSGNQGIEDQIAALKWVKENITAFGGDPKRVTIMGESAGGESVAILMASPQARGLFQRAIAESGNDALPIDPSENAQFDRNTAEHKGEAFAHAVGAAHLADLRATSGEDLKKVAWSPRTVVDGYVLREDLTTTYLRHRQSDVPLLVGWNAQEGKDLAPEILDTRDFTAAKHNELVTKLLGYSPSETLLKAYPGKTDDQAKASLNQLTNDWWGWRMWYWAGLQAKHGQSKSYVYFFAHLPAELPNCGYGCGVGHGAEIQYVFDHLDWEARPWTAEDRRLASKLGETWANFAKTGNPNATGLPAWPVFDGSNGTIHRIGSEADLKTLGQLPDFSLFPQPPK